MMENNPATGSHYSPEQDRPSSILVYGRDAQLLETRRWVLERSGMEVTTTTELSDIDDLLTRQTIDLLILCHTLSPEEGDLCLMKANALRPAMKRLVLTANTLLGFLGPREEKASAFDGPKTLIAIVQKLLGAHSPEMSPS